MKYLTLLLILPLFGMASKPVEFTTPVSWCEINLKTPTEKTDNSPLSLSEITGYKVFYDGVEQKEKLDNWVTAKSWKPEGTCPVCVQLVTETTYDRESKFSECLNI